MSRLRQLLLDLLRVPSEPQPPPGSPESLRVFRASPRFFQYSLLGWGLKQAGALVGLLFSLGTVSLFDIEDVEAFSGFGWLDSSLLALAFALFLVQLPLGLLMLRLGYELRWYMVSDRSLRIREGLFRVREKTMTVANIQNLSVRQGPVQKLFGIADLEVQTAGGGGTVNSAEEAKAGSMHVGVLRGLHDVAEVRDLIRESLGKRRDAGLGDPDEAPDAERSPAAAEGGELLVASAREVLQEVRALRRQLVAENSMPAPGDA